MCHRYVVPPMSALDEHDDWREAIDGVDARLIDGFQSGIPVVERPLAEVAAAVGTTEADTIARVRRLRETGILRRFGPVLNPPVIGSSTLAALSVPDDRFESTAETVNGYRQVNHNYRRDHEWNMWFVVTAGSLKRRDAIVDEIGDRTGLDVLVLPMLTDYYIDLEFPVVNGDRLARESGDPDRSAAGTDPETGTGTGTGTGTETGTETPSTVGATRIRETAAADLSALDRRLLLEIQDGFPLSTTPYREIAEAVDAPVEDVLRAVAGLLGTGCIKRIGCVVNHVVTGFSNNCMVVWDVPDGELDAVGGRVGALPSVTLCYHRPRRPAQDWPHNLFTMVHGREAAAVDATIDEIAAEHVPYAHERLYSTATLKQTGARYESLVGD
jgi:DNA-binding Lrp family transcriptional regulator